MNISDAIRLLKLMSYTDERVLPANEGDQLFKAEEWAYQLHHYDIDQAITAYRDMSRLMDSTPTIRDITRRCRDNRDHTQQIKRQLTERTPDQDKEIQP